MGHYKAADNAVLSVTRENDHLNVQFSGEREADAVYPEGSTRFFYANTKFDAKIEFQIDAEGRPIAAVLLQNSAPNHHAADRCRPALSRLKRPASRDFKARLPPREARRRFGISLMVSKAATRISISSALNSPAR